jgi:hypothetical protein
MPKPGQKTVTVSGKALTLLEQRYRIEKTKKPNLSFAAFISEAALMELERRNILTEAQFISVIGFEDNTLIIRDLRKAGQLIEVHIKNKKLKCIADDDFDCIHVGFAYFGVYPNTASIVRISAVVFCIGVALPGINSITPGERFWLFLIGGLWCVLVPFTILCNINNL